MNDFFEKHKEKVENFRNEWAEEFKRRTEDKTPVRTGNLKAGYVIEMTEDGFEMSNEMPYFGYVEMGTSKQAPSRMAYRAFLEAEQITRIALERS